MDTMMFGGRIQAKNRRNVKERMVQKKERKGKNKGKVSPFKLK